MRAILLSSVVLLGACGPSLTPDEADVLASDSADLTTGELKVATTGMTLWLKPTFTKVTRDAQVFWVLKGRTSVNLEGAMAYVPDDAMCQTTVLSARTFEIACDPRGEINTLASGLPLFLSLRQPDGRNATAHLVVAPRFTDFSGSAAVSVAAELLPIYVANAGLTYRGTFSAAAPVTVRVGPATLATRVRSGSTRTLDLTFDQLMAGALSTGASFTAGTDVKTAQFTFAVTNLELKRTADAYATWPTSFACASAVQQCLNGIPAAPDFEACGTYRQVQRCNIPSNLPNLGGSPDGRAAITSALADINAALPAERQVTSNGFYVQMPVGGAKPSMAQVVAAWQKMEMTVTVFEADLTAGQLNTDLDAFGARTLVPAVQQTVLQQSFKAQRLVSQTAKYELVYFSGAARLEVIRLPK